MKSVELDALLAQSIEWFEKLIELAPEDREEPLRELRSYRADVAARVAQLLSADASTGGPLDDGLERMAAGALSHLANHDSTTVHKAGEAIGPWRLRQHIGSGGMGEVWLAERNDGQYEQTAALKLLKRGMESDAALQRFRRERQILARLEHNGIARLIEGGITESGLPYFAMEYVQGEPLIDYAQSHALDIRARVQLTIDLCQAVDFAHRRLIVHRDLKPDNVLVAQTGSLKVLDFGIAKLLDETGDATTTQVNTRLMSPAYASPEQIFSEPVAVASDVYAIGLLLFELLSGCLPHERRTGEMATVSADIARDATERPSRARRGAAGSTPLAPRAQRDLIDNDLDLIVLQALRREPEQRYRSAAEFADDLTAWLNRRPIRARPTTLRYRVAKFVARHRILVLVASSALLAIVAMLALVLWQASIAHANARLAERQAEQARNERARAEREAAAARENALRTSRVKEFLMNTFVHADPLRREAGSAKSIGEILGDALVRIDSDLNDDVKLQIDLLDDFGEILAAQGRFEEASGLLTRAIAQAEGTYGLDHPVVAESLLNLAFVYNYSGKTLQAAAFVERAVTILEQHEDSTPLARANALTHLAAIREAQSRHEDSLTLMWRALDLQRRHGAPDDPQLANILLNLGVALVNSNRHAEAEPLLREAIALSEPRLGLDHPLIMQMLGSLSEVLYLKGDLEEVLDIYQRRLRSMRATFAGDHPWTAESLNDLGWLLLKLERHGEGNALLDESIAMYTALGSTDVLTPIRHRANGMRLRGDFAAAMAMADLGWRICQQKQLEHPRCILMRTSRAAALTASGQAKLGLAEAKIALSELDALNRTDTADSAQAHEASADAYLALADRHGAKLALQKALAIALARFGAEHRESVRLRKRLDGLQEFGH